MRHTATVVRCETCNAGLTSERASEMRNGAMAMMPNDPPAVQSAAIVGGFVTDLLLAHIFADPANETHRIVIENYKMICKHHGAKDCACPAEALIREDMVKPENEHWQ